jgi:hypothetical protein
VRPFLSVLLTSVVGLVAVGAIAQETTLEVRLDPPRFGVEDNVRLVVKINEPPGGIGVPDLGSLDNLEVVGGPSRGTEVRFINGVSSQAVSFTWVLHAQKVGAAAVGPITVRAAGTTLSADRITADVVAGSVAPPPRSRVVDPFDPFGQIFGRRAQPEREGKLALRQLVSDGEVVVGEPVIASVVLDTTVTSLDRFEWISIPSYPGWWAQRVEISEQPAPEVIQWDGAQAVRYLVARSVLVPLSSGDLELPAAEARIGIRGRSLFAPPQVVERSTGSVTVAVKSRPPAPPGYGGAVGDLRYSVSLAPEHVAFGESSVVTVRLEGKGNLPLVERPSAWPACSSCETYPPEEDSNVKVDASGLSGSREWRMTVLPRESGELELEPVTMSVFDPAAGRYRSQTLGPLTLVVDPPPATPTPSPVPGEVQAGDRGAADDVGSRPRGPDSSWMWVAAALVVGVVLGGVVVALAGRRRHQILPPASRGQSPADRARELQNALERWWLDVRDRPIAAELREPMESLRRELEAVRFAPGRADHSHTVEDLESRLRRLIRRA